MIFDRSVYIEQECSLKVELKLLFKQQAPKVIFEIGACEGEDTIKYSRLFPSAHIFSFEPLPRNVVLIQDNISKYRIVNASIHPIALSSSEGKANLHVSSGRPSDAIESD